MSKILIISPTPTHPQNAGNRTRIRKLVLLLREWEYQVHFAFIPFEKADITAMEAFFGKHFLLLPYVRQPSAAIANFWWRVKKKIGLDEKWRRFLHKGNYGIDDFYDPSINNVLRDYLSKHQFDIVIQEYVYFSKALEIVDPNIPKLIDTHDIYTDRNKKFSKKGYKPEFFFTTKAQEAKGLNRADVVIAIQPSEKALLQEISPRPVIIMGHPVNTFNTYVERKKRRKILYLASRNTPNYLCITEFMQRIFPLIIAAHPDVELIIAGGICDRIDNYDNCRKTGQVEDPTALYQEADICINPIQIGTGLKIKNIEAMGYAKPLITTPDGTEGIDEGIGKAFLVAADSMGFANCVSKLFSDEDFYHSVSQAAYSFAVSYNRETTEELQNILKKMIVK